MAEAGLTQISRLERKLCNDAAHAWGALLAAKEVARHHGGRNGEDALAVMLKKLHRRLENRANQANQLLCNLHS